MFRLDAFRMSAETQLNASEGNVAGKGGIGRILGKGGIGGIGGKRGKEDRRDLPKRHQSFARTLIWCPAVCVTESVCPSPSPSSAAVQCRLGKVSVLRPHPHLVPCSVCWEKCLSFTLAPCYDLIFDLRGAPGIFPISVVSLISPTPPLPPISPLPATFPSEAFN